MTNTLIPYSFIPGTKAKAGEVNANFIALAENLQELQSDLSDRIADLSNEVSEGMEELYANCIADGVPKSNTVSNAIVSGPNGIVTNTSSIVTACAELKVLLPNGRNDDNTLKSTEYILDEEKILDLGTYGNGKYYVWLKSDGTFITCSKDNYYISISQPANFYGTAIWYSPETNVLKQYDVTTSSWVTVLAVLLCLVTKSNNIISDVSVQKPIQSITYDNLSLLSGLSMPSSRVVSVTQNSQGIYYAPASGYYKCSCVASAAGSYVSLSTDGYSAQNIAVAKNNGLTLTIPVMKGSKLIVYSYGMSSLSLSFSYAGGEK